tara:strand:+ start:2276 stop:2947 length:672 start_codon:yes stop_codon:yes gene_type:complete
MPKQKKTTEVRELPNKERQQLLADAKRNFTKKINERISDDEFNSSFRDSAVIPGYTGQSSSSKIDGTPRNFRTRPFLTERFQREFRNGNTDNAFESLIAHTKDEKDLYNTILGSTERGGKKRKTKKRTKQSYKKRGGTGKGKTIKFKGSITEKKFKKAAEEVIHNNILDMLEKGTANSKNINKMKKTLTQEVNNATKKLITSASTKGDWDIEKGLKSSLKSKK